MRRRDALTDPEVDHGLRELEAALAGEPGADPELAALVSDVAAIRPEPDAAFLASLDARVHAGFPAHPGAPRREPWHRRIRRPQVLVRSLGGLLAAAVVAVVIGTAGHGTPGDDASSSSSAGAPSTEVAPPAAADSAAAAGG